MKNLTDISSRMKSIKDTRQITKAMELISVSKLRHTQEKFDKNKEYFSQLCKTISNIAANSKDVINKFLIKRQTSKKAYIVISSDKGFSGGYNHEIISFAQERMSHSEDNFLLSIGRTGTEFFNKKNITVDAEYLQISSDPRLVDARNISYDIINMFDNHLVDEIYIIYTDAVNGNVARPMEFKLLPLTTDILQNLSNETETVTESLFDPNPEEVLDLLIPQYIVGMVYTILIHAATAENKQRMVAMENATRNADEILAKLNVEYNRARQEKITNELLEIVSGQNSLKKG